MTKNNLIKIKLDEAIEVGRNKDGKVIKITLFHSIEIIEGELYGMTEGYQDPPLDFKESENHGQIRKIRH